MGTYKQRPNGTWYSREYIGIVNGERKQKMFTAPTRKELREKITAYRYNHPNPSDTCGLTLKQAMIVYVESKDNILSPSTLVGYDNIINRHFPTIINKKLSALSNQEIQYAINQEAALYSPKTVRNAVGLLSAAIGMTGRQLPKFTLPQKIKREPRIPTEQELLSLLEMSDRYHVKLPVYLGAFLGLRVSEVCGLDLFRDYDPKTQTLMIQEACVRGRGGAYYFKPPKTTAGTRRLGVPDFIVPIIREQMRISPRLPNPNMIKGRYDSLKRKVGLPDISFHKLRHYFCSTLLATDTPKEYVVRIMGHSTNEMADRIYFHIKQSVFERTVNKVGDFYNTEVAPKIEKSQAE